MMRHSSRRRALPFGTGVYALLFIGLYVIFTRAEIIETCFHESFEASCGSNEIILMNSAEYGRRGMGRCINEEEPHMGCWTDVLPLLDGWCSGRPECGFEFPNRDLEEMNKNSQNTCQKFLSKYMKVDMHCMKVESACSNGANNLNTEEGLLSSHVTDQTGCGSSRSPWKISVSQGKTINLTMFDFGAYEENGGSNYVSCKHTYGYIIERSLGINHTICGGQVREKALYSSKTNNVEIHLFGKRQSSDAQFLIKFEASGCADLVRPPNAWYKREGNEAVIGCETNDQEWRLTCTGNAWQGTVGNCSIARGPSKDNELPETVSQMEVGFDSMIIMTGIACGVFVAVVVAVMCGVIYIKKYRMKQETKRVQTTYATMEKQYHSNYRPVNDNSSNTTATATDAPFERLVDVPGTWVHSDTFGRHGTLTSYPDQCMCPTLPGARA